MLQITCHLRLYINQIMKTLHYRSKKEEKNIEID